MNVSTKLGRIAGIAVAAVGLSTLGMAGVASASTAAPAASVAPALAPGVTCTIQTEDGHYLTAVDSGGRTTDTFHSNATRIQAWEEFRLNNLGDGYFDIQTVDGHYVTAVNGGGLSSGDVLHTAATHVGAWEIFHSVC